MPLTPGQIEAVRARGNVIVVAGAGTGKTSTLVERCVSLLAEGDSIESVLMVTFTEAAAAEMKHRLRIRLAEAAENSPPERATWWHEQLALLESARICTLHGFCLQLIRENFGLLGIDPSVKVLDEQQIRPLVEAALDSTLAPHFSAQDEAGVAVRELIHRYGLGDPGRIRSLVLKLYRHTQSLDAPERWLGTQRAVLEQAFPESWHRWRATESLDWAGSWLTEVGAAAGSAENLARCARALNDIARGAAPGRLATALAEILAADAAEWPKRMKTRLRKPFEAFFKEAEFLSSQFEEADSGDGLLSDWQNVRRSMLALLALTHDFAVRYAGAKKEMGGVDFADLEQFALKLLRDEQGGPAAVAVECRERIKHAFVDECQDINAAQDAILRAVSRDAARTGNRFLVGDVKQSIYQFRLARPELFRGYEKAWRDGGAGQRVLLPENFRSKPGIIAFVNALFAPLMRDEIGGVNYEPLIAAQTAGGQGTPGPATGDHCVEFHLISTGGTEGEAGEEEGGGGEFEDLLAVEREARLVALRLRELREARLEIWDKEAGASRPVAWRDMAVLLRSPANRVEAFAQEFHRCGVPLQAARGGFLQSTEIMDLLSLLRLMDNPLQDIPLLAVLRSPLVALTLDELAAIRASSGARRFWVALNEFRQAAARGSGGSKTALLEKVEWLVQRLAVWRELLRQTSLSQCIETILAETHYEAVVLAGERGAERVANVRKLIGAMRQYDPYQRQGLLRFLKFVDTLLDAEQDIEPAPAQPADAVRLMSIHRSKGLEFPVVAVACLGGLFNLSDAGQDVLVDEDLGVCAKAVADGGARHPTLPHWMAARRQRRRVVGEELRLLYVASTRARDRLLLTATATRKGCESWEAAPPRVFTSREILKARSPLDWLLSWLPMVTRTEDWQGNGGVGELLQWKVWTDARALAVPAMDCSIPQAGPPTAIICADAGSSAESVKRRIRWVYPHATAATEPAKTSVTALRRKAAELVDDDAAGWGRGAGIAFRRRPAGGKLGATEIGTLHHEFLQRMVISGECDEADLRGQIATMAERGELTAEAAAALDIAAMAGFWRGRIGSEIRASADSIRRELPFTARFTLDELERITGARAMPGMEGEFVVVQGVADLVVMRDAEIWLLDFKTDDAGPGQLATKVAEYQAQLRLYSAALEAIYGRPVTRRWLHFLKPGETVAV